MKVTYTSEDGTTFESEEDCIAYEATSSKIRQIFGGREKETEKSLGFDDGFINYLRQGFYLAEDLMRYRRSILRLAELLQPSA